MFNEMPVIWQYIVLAGVGLALALSACGFTTAASNGGSTPSS